MSATGQSIVNDALIYLALMDPAGTPSASDSTTLLQVLNNMWESWGIDEGLIYAIIASRFALTADIGTYTIGVPAGSTQLPNFNSPRPARIYRAVITQASGGAINSNSLFAGGSGYVVNDTGVIQGGNGTVATYTVNTVTAGAVATYTISGAGTGYTPMLGATTATGGAQAGIGTGFRISIASVTAGGQNRNELNIVEATKYYAHNDLQASAAVPDEIYPDYNVNQDGYATLYFFPVPKVLAATNLELDQAVPFTTWTLTDSYQIPQAYRDALGWALAFRALPIFGEAVGQGAAQVVAAEGAKAEARLRKMNSVNRQAPEQQMMTPGAQQEPPRAA